MSGDRDPKTASHAVRIETEVHIRRNIQRLRNDAPYEGKEMRNLVVALARDMANDMVDSFEKGAGRVVFTMTQIDPKLAVYSDEDCEPDWEPAR